MAFYNRDGSVAQAQQGREESGARAMMADPDIRNAMRGLFTGKYADLAAQLPKAWPAAIRNVQVARSIAQDKGIDDSGVTWTGSEWQSANTGTPLAVELAPYVMGGVTGAGAAGAFGGGTGAVNTAVNAGGLVGTGEATTTGALAIPAASTSSVLTATVPTIAGGGAAGGGAAGGGAAATSWLTKFLGKDTTIPALANVFGNIYAANKQAGASDAALKQQQEQFDAALKVAKEQQDYDRATAADALNYNRNQYGDYLGRLAPYAATGNEANARLSQFMGTPQASAGTSVPSTVSTPKPPPQPPAAAAPAADGPPASTPTPSAAPPATANGATVRMRAPDGVEQDVPADQVAHYQQLGAIIVGNRYRTMDSTATLPHFASGVQNFSGGAAIVGEQGPEMVNLPPGSSVTPTTMNDSAAYGAYTQHKQDVAGTYTGMGGYTGPDAVTNSSGGGGLEAYGQNQQDMLGKYLAAGGAPIDLSAGVGTGGPPIAQGAGDSPSVGASSLPADYQGGGPLITPGSPEDLANQARWQNAIPVGNPSPADILGAGSRVSRSPYDQPFPQGSAYDAWSRNRLNAGAGLSAPEMAGGAGDPFSTSGVLGTGRVGRPGAIPIGNLSPAEMQAAGNNPAPGYFEGGFPIGPAADRNPMFGGTTNVDNQIFGPAGPAIDPMGQPMVRLRTPDGTAITVPQSQVPYYLQRGAMRLGNRYKMMGGV